MLGRKASKFAGLGWWGRRKSEDKLVKAAREWRSTFDSIEWPILMLDIEGRITRLNRAAQMLAGLEFHQLLGRPVEAVASWQPWRKMAEVARVAAETRAGLSCHVSGDRSREWQVSASFVPGTPPEDDRITVVARDITEVIRLEAELRRSEAMAAMGRLVSGVAHEVRNPLFAFSATVDALEARLGAREEYAQFVTALRGELTRLGRLMRDLLDYGKPSGLELSEADIGDVVASAVRACKPLAKERQVAIHNRVESGLARLRLDQARVAQVVQNLVENALHYSASGAAVEVKGEVISVNNSRWIEIFVVDRGAGFRPEDLPRVFEPFHTRRRGGTGLGLSIVKRIVEAHGGTVRAANAPGGGAIMTFGLPLSEKSPGREGPQPVLGRPSASDSRV